MNKKDFLLQLHKGLSGLPQGEIEERLTFYSEMIDDRMEEGLSEEDAVSGIGSVDCIISQITADSPLHKAAHHTSASKKRFKAWEIVLLVLGSPVWFSLLVAAFAVVLSLYVVLWSMIISLWAVFASLAGCALGGIAAGIGFILGGNSLPGVALVGAGMICAGLSIFLFYGCKASTKGTVSLTKKMIFGISACFAKEEAK